MSTNTHSRLDAKRNVRPLDMAVYFITFGLGVTTLAAASSALVKRNGEIGAASDAAAAQGITLILATNALTEPGFALSTAATGTFLNALTLFLISFKIPHFQQKLMWTLPVLAAFNFVFLLATTITVFYEAKHAQLTIYGAAQGQQIPPAALLSSLEAEGLTLGFWGKSYVRFMAIVAVPTTFFALLTAVLAYRFWQRERAVTRAQETSGISDTQDASKSYDPNGLSHVQTDGEKPMNEHVEHV